MHPMKYFTQVYDNKVSSHEKYDFIPYGGQLLVALCMRQALAMRGSDDVHNLHQSVEGDAVRGWFHNDRPYSKPLSENRSMSKYY